jgi:hypothetical protein
MTVKLGTGQTTVISFRNRQHHTVYNLRLETVDEVSGPTLSPGRGSYVYSTSLCTPLLRFSFSIQQQIMCDKLDFSLCSLMIQ